MNSLNKKTIEDIEVSGKRVLVRCDFNVPLKDGVITNDKRIVAALPTIQYLVSHNAKVILCSHLGRPKGEYKEEFSLAPVAARLSELLGQDVKLAKDENVVGENAKALVSSMTDGQVILLENVRFRKEETKNEENFSKELASLADVYVNDAFGTAHRAHCSTTGVASFLPAVCGYLIQKEISVMGQALNNPKRPLVAILGGAKVSDKIGVINNLLEKVDTLIVGGGYHGKSTLLNALELGVYNHIAGDGREYVITDDSALKLRSEDGRFIRNVDISLFINDLPNKKDTRCFSTEDASGSTSQAAGIVEGIEAGSKVFLLDEDTSATNFMVRDTFMQEVISREKEPITPFLERAGDLYEKAGISTILVAGSSGAFFHIADTVIQMDSYHPVDISTKVRALCGKYPLNEQKVSAFSMPQNHRILSKKSPGIRSHGRGAGKPERLKIKVHGKDGFLLGHQDVDLRYIEQIVDSEQTAALGLILKYAIENLVDGQRTVSEIVQLLSKELQKKGLAAFADGSSLPCGYAVPRIQEIYSCFNRYRG